MTECREIRTVDTLERLDDLAERHRLAVVTGEMRQDTGAERDLLAQVALRKAVVRELELGRVGAAEVGVEDAERVELGNVVSADLVRAHEQLDLYPLSAPPPSKI